MSDLQIICEGLRKVCGIAVHDANVLRERVAELEAQAERDKAMRDAVYKLGEAQAHLNDGHYLLSLATNEVNAATKAISDIAEQVYYAALAAEECEG